MSRGIWFLMGLSIVALLPLRWLFQAIGVPRNFAAAAAGLVVMVVAFAVVLALERRPREDSSDDEPFAERADSPSS